MSRQVVGIKSFSEKWKENFTFPFAAQSTTRWQALEERSEDGDRRTHKNRHRHRETHRYTLKQEHIETETYRKKTETQKHTQTESEIQTKTQQSDESIDFCSLDF